MSAQAASRSGQQGEQNFRKLWQNFILGFKKNNKNRAKAYVKGRSRKEAGLGRLESLYVFLKIMVEANAPTFQIT